MERLDLITFFFLNYSVKVHVKRIKRKATEWLQIGKVWDPHGGETVQYLNSGGEYTNPHMWSNCIVRNTCIHMHMSISNTGENMNKIHLKKINYAVYIQLHCITSMNLYNIVSVLIPQPWGKKKAWGCND